MPQSIARNRVRCAAANTKNPRKAKLEPSSRPDETLSPNNARLFTVKGSPDKRERPDLDELRRLAGYLTFPEACVYLKCKKTWLYQRMAARELAYHKVGRERLFRLIDLDNLIAAERREIFRKGKAK